MPALEPAGYEALIAHYGLECLPHFHEFVEELDFLDRYDWVKERMQSVVDLPDRQFDLLVRLLRQNRGHLSQRKRETEFRLLTDDEIVWLEAAFAEGFDV